jgi:DNA polymerase III epsilon subunit-like protein
MFKLDRDLIIIDVETTGTSYETSSVIQLGAVRFRKDGEIGSSFMRYIKPYKEEWNIESAGVHKITRTFLEEKGQIITHALHDFEDWVTEATFQKSYYDDVYIAQWACGFDFNMLLSAYQYCFDETKIKDKFPFTFRSYDIASIVRFVLACQGKKTYYGCHKCARMLGVNTGIYKAHDALDDAKITAECLKKAIEYVAKANNNIKPCRCDSSSAKTKSCSS